MPKTTFNNGTPVPAAFFNAINNPTFVETPDNDGEFNLITNNDLSNAAGQLKPEWVAFRDEFKVSAGAGLSVTYTGGSVELPNGSRVTIAPGSLALADNTTSYAYVDAAGSVTSAELLPTQSLLLAQVTTVSGEISGAIIDRRPRYKVAPTFKAVKIFGGNGDQGAYTLSGSDTFNEGEYYFSSFTIEAGAQLTIEGAARIFVSGPVQIDGELIVTATINGGFGHSTNSIYVYGGRAGSGPGGFGLPYNFVLAPHGSGGQSGFSGLASSSNGKLGDGGKGGGGVIFEAAGPIDVTGTIRANGANGGNGLISAGSGSTSGGGGGSGGLIYFKSLVRVHVTPTAVLEVQGGDGGNQQTVGANTSAGGYGGGGGFVVLASPDNNVSGATITLSGGSRGSGIDQNNLGGGFGGGFGGGYESVGQLVLRDFVPVG